ncbi:MAG: hypothetical protein RIT52_2365 [Pseudomonadota bacterium]|jgi:hypothetical protein
MLIMAGMPKGEAVKEVWLLTVFLDLNVYLKH